MAACLACASADATNRAGRLPPPSLTSLPPIPSTSSMMMTVLPAGRRLLEEEEDDAAALLLAGALAKNSPRPRLPVMSPTTASSDCGSATNKQQREGEKSQHKKEER